MTAISNGKVYWWLILKHSSGVPLNIFQSILIIKLISRGQKKKGKREKYTI